MEFMKVHDLGYLVSLLAKCDPANASNSHMLLVYFELTFSL